MRRRAGPRLCAAVCAWAALAIAAAVPVPSPGLAQATDDPAQGFRTAPAAGAPGRRDGLPPAVPASPSGPAVGSYEPAILRTFECPREAIARMIASAVEEGEFSEALELEREVLVLCRDRQGILQELVSGELDLAAALRESASARAQEALALETARREAEARVAAARDAILEAALTEAGPARPPKPPDYGWYAVMGSGDDLRAAVTDGVSSWRVRAGDRLPGGVRVVAVEARPPGVRVRGWSGDRLPWRPGSGR